MLAKEAVRLVVTALVRSERSKWGRVVVLIAQPKSFELALQGLHEPQICACHQAS